MDITQYYGYKLTKILLRIIGQWPYDNLQGAKIRRLLVLIILLIASGFEIKNIIVNYSDTDFVIDAIPEMIMMSGVTSTFIILYSSRTNSTEAMDIVCLDWKSLQTKEEIRIKESYTKFISLLGVIGTVYTFAIYLPCLIIGKFLYITSDHNRTRFDLLFVDERNLDMKSKFLFLIYVSIVFTINFIFIFGNALIIGIYIFHVMGTYHIVGFQLEYLLDLIKEKDEMDIIELNNKLHQSLILCIKKHSKAIKFSTILESQYTSIIFSIEVHIIIAVSMTMIHALDMKTVHIKAMLFAFGQVLFLSTLCATCQKLIDLHNSVADRVYQSTWYEYPVYLQKLILFIIHRSNTPAMFTSTKCIALSLENLSVIIKTAISYYMVLKNTR